MAEVIGKVEANFDTLFEWNERVFKVGGDYTFEGNIRGIICKKSGQVRYVVEDDRGLLFIFNATQLLRTV